MNTRDKHKYLTDTVSERAQYFKTESEKHKWLFRTLRYWVFGLTAASTGLAGISVYKPDLGRELSLVIVFVSALAGILTSVEGLRKAQELWIHERTTYYALLDFERDVKFSLDENSKPDLLDKYFSRLQNLLAASGVVWSKKFSNATGALTET